MRDLHTYDYAVVRVVPRVERAEFVNAGIILSCDVERILQAAPIVREGIDVGYYSSAYDNPLFRLAIANASGSQRETLEGVLDDLRFSDDGAGGGLLLGGRCHDASFRVTTQHKEDRGQNV